MGFTVALINDTEVFNLQSGKLVRRIIDIYGKSYREQLCFLPGGYLLLSMSADYIGKPGFARKTRGEQFFFVNDRFIKHSYMHHAVIWSAFDAEPFLRVMPSILCYFHWHSFFPLSASTSILPKRRSNLMTKDRYMLIIMAAAVKAVECL